MNIEKQTVQKEWKKLELVIYVDIVCIKERHRNWTIMKLKFQNNLEVFIQTCVTLNNNDILYDSISDNNNIVVSLLKKWNVKI